MLVLAVASAVVAAVLVLVLSVLLMMKPRKLKLSARVWKFVHLSFEADLRDE